MRSPFAALILFAGITTWAEPPPPDVAAILAKARSGTPLSAQEQQRLREWGTGNAPGTLTPGTTMPPDVAAIMSRSQQGIRPTPAEVARLKAWSEEQKNQRGTFEERRSELEGATNPGRGPMKGSPFLEGTISWKQLVAARTPCEPPTPGFSTATQTITGTFKVRVSTVVGSKPIDFSAIPPDKGPWRLKLEPLEPSVLTVGSSGVDCDHNPIDGSTTQPGSMAPTEIAFGEGARPYVNGLLSTPGPDSILPESPWGRGLPPGIPPQMLAEGRGATFQIDAAAIRKGLAARNLIGLGGTYTSKVTNDGATQTTTTTFTFSAEGPTSKLSIAFVDEAGVPSVEQWKKWLPRLWTESQEDAKVFDVKPKDDSVRARLRLALEANATCRLKVELKKVSIARGIAGNYPLDGAEDFDLVLLEPKKNGPTWTIAGDRQSATLDRAVDAAQIDVVALDTAAYGQVFASCLDHPELEAVERTLGNGYLVLPYDANDNKLADSWEEEEHVLSEHQDGRDDRDDVPDALLHHKGDGLGLFEEYRGFVVRQPQQTDTEARHKRLSAHVMNVLVSDQTTDQRSHDALKDGWPLFVTATGLRLDVVPKRLLKTFPRHKHPSWANFNTPVEMDAKHHPLLGVAGPAAAAIPFVDDDFHPRPDNVYATTKEADGTANASQMPRAPIDVEAVEMFPSHGRTKAAEVRTWDAGPLSKKYLTTRKLPLELARQAMATREAKALYGQLVLATMHEFVHAFGVFHHSEAGTNNDEANFSGAITCPTRYIDNDPRWKWATWLAEWTPSKGAWVPPSFKNGYDTYWPYNPELKSTPKTFLDAMDADVVAAPGDWHQPWTFCSKCLSKMHLWAADGDRFPEEEKVQNVINQ